MKFVQARHYTKTDGRNIRHLVFHSMEASEENLKTAENVANYFATTDRRASAHYCFDGDSEVQCVHDKDVAYAAPGANHDGLHFEMAGTAHQTREQWLDTRSKAIIEKTTARAAHKCVELHIPPRFITNDELRRDVKGCIFHYQASEVFKRSDHWDPGKNFPVDYAEKRLVAHYRNLLGLDPVTGAPSKPDFEYVVIAESDLDMGMAMFVADRNDLKIVQYPHPSISMEHAILVGGVANRKKQYEALGVKTILLSGDDRWDTLKEAREAYDLGKRQFPVPH